MLHTPDWQASFAFGRLQGSPQRPQSWTLVSRFVSQPVSGLPSQLAKPGLHGPMLQLLAAHAAAEVLASGRQTWSHDPQLLGSRAVSTSQPSDVVALQSANPGLQPPSVH